MESISLKCSAIYSGLISCCAYLFGGFSEAMIFLLVFNIIDLITGILLAFKRKEVSSNVMKVGLAKKFGMWSLIIVANGVDVIMGSPKAIFKMIVVFSLVSQEGLSIVENCANLGLLVPKNLKNALKQISDTSSRDTDNNKIDN